MGQFLRYVLVTVFAVFVGSQITEGVLLVPYWQSLSAKDFYEYYNQFGPLIGKFYTILTVIAALIPIVVAFYCKNKNAKAFKLSLVSSVFAVLFVACFYIYFKDANTLFYKAKLPTTDLANELVIWSYWHWSRIVLEICSLVFLLLAFQKMDSEKL